MSLQIVWWNGSLFSTKIRIPIQTHETYGLARCGLKLRKDRVVGLALCLLIKCNKGMWTYRSLVRMLRELFS
jgi:hypothetical protein